MEVDDILANEMVEFCVTTGSPVVIKLIIGLGAQGLEAGYIANWRIEPHVKVFARRIGNLETEIRRIAADIPFLQTAL
jgi:hypothetical protein